MYFTYVKIFVYRELPRNSGKGIRPTSETRPQVSWCRLGAVTYLVGSSGKVPKLPTIIRCLRPKNSYICTVLYVFFTWRVLRNKQNATLKDTLNNR